MKLKSTLTLLCALFATCAWAGIPDGVGGGNRRAADGFNDQAWEIFFDNTLTSHSKHGILNALQWTCTGATTHPEGATTPNGEWLTKKAAFVAVADGGDVVFTSPYDFQGQKGWSGHNFKYVAINAIVYNADGSASTFQPQFKFLGFSERTDPAVDYRDPAQDITFSFDAMEDNSTCRQTVWSNTKDYNGTCLCRQFQIIFPNLQAGSVVKLFGVGLYCSYAEELSTAIAPDQSKAIQWFDYDLGALGQSYWGYENPTTDNVNNTAFSLMSRIGCDSLVLVGALGNQTIEGLTFTGKVNYDRQPAWGDPNAFRNGKNTLTNEEALKTFGQWYDYTIEVSEPCYANINLVIGGNYANWSTIANGWGGNGDNIVSLSEMPGTVWPRRYLYSYVLSVDGRNIDVADNYKRYPTFYKTIIPQSGSLNSANYYSDAEFLDLLDHPEDWVNYPANGTDTRTDTLHLWPSSIYGNQWVPFSSAERHPALGDQYVNIPLTAGKHTIRVKKLVGAGDVYDGFVIKTSALTDVPVSAITVSPSSINTLTAQGTTLSYTITPPNATNQDVSWSCDNAQVSITDNGDGTITVAYHGVESDASGATITATADDGWGATATVPITKMKGSNSNYPDATPIPAGTIKNSWTYIGGLVKSDLTTNPIEGNRITTPWTVTGAKQIRANASTAHRSWAGAVAEGGDVIFSTEQTDDYNAADGSPTNIAVTVITYNENGSNSIFEPVLRLTNTNDGSTKAVKLGLADDSPNRQTFTTVGLSIGLLNNHFNKVEVIFPDLDENSVVSLTGIQFELNGTRNLAPSSTVYIPSHFYDQGGQDVAYHSYMNRNAWEVYWRRTDVDSVNIEGGFANVNTGMDAAGATSGLEYGYLENIHGPGGMGGNPENICGLANDNNNSMPWTYAQATDYYGTWFNYTVNVTAPVYASVNISTAQRFAHAAGNVNGNGDRGIVLTPEGNKMVWSRRYAGGAYVLNLDGNDIATNQKSFPSIMKRPDRIYTKNGVAGDDAYTVEELADYKAVIDDPTQWTSTLLEDGSPNDTLFTWANVTNDYHGTDHRNFYIDKMVNPDAGDQWVMIPLAAGKHTFKIKNVYGRFNSLGTIEIKAGAEVTPVTQIRLRDHTDGIIAELDKDYPETVTYQVIPNNATNMALDITCTDPDVKWVVKEVDTRGIGTIVFSYEPETPAAGAPRKVRRKADGDPATITIASADAFSSASPITLSVGTLTGVEEVNATKQVEKVLYYNPLGIVSEEPFPGLNVVVTTYNDGSKATRKVVK